jgi:ABC-2 type transport system permease protein
MMDRLSVFLGAARYEFRMQLRRRAIWFVPALFGALLLPLWYLFESCDLHGCMQHQGEGGPLVWSPPIPGDAVLQWAQFVAVLLPVGAGLVLADRLARDRQHHVDEVFETASGALGPRLFGKYLGSTAATLIPIAALYGAVVLYILTQAPQGNVLPLAVAAFAAVVAPAVLFAGGLSVALPAVVRVPVYQFLFIVYWFGANLMTPKVGLPSLTSTWLNATGPWAQAGLFHFKWFNLTLQATPAQALGSIALLVGLGILAVAGAWAYLRAVQTGR